GDRPERDRSPAARDRPARALGRRMGRPGRRARQVNGRVLHVVKVAGISGAENHLLLLLPALRDYGWDVEAVMLHEGEPGAEEVAARLEAGARPPGAHAPPRRV